MKTTCETHAKFHKEAGTASAVAGESAWTLGDLPSFAPLLVEKAQETSSMKKEILEVKRMVDELPSYLLTGEFLMNKFSLGERSINRFFLLLFHVSRYETGGDRSFHSCSRRS